ncbi:MAG TPA: CocE/NonD family hydrolase [Steroidobacteraceae bacterium]|nr:CocE/NonD family hydrolase [Steroidobacteraceae bacterium]
MKALLFALLLVLPLSWASAQDLEFHPPASAADPAAAAVMRDLATRILPVYQENDQDRYLKNLSALQLVARNFTGAWATRQSLRDRRKSSEARKPLSSSIIYDMYVQARDVEAEKGTPFDRGFAQAYRDTVSKLSDQDAYNVTGWLALPVSGFQEVVQRTFDQWRSKGSIPQVDAVDLIWNYLVFDAYRSFHPLIAALNEEDDGRRYVKDYDVLIDTPEHESISAIMVRPKDDTKPLPTLLEFTIYVDARTFARECAAHGYVGIVAFTRGERRSRGKVLPYEHDGEDARAVIDWIAKQNWSDGRVGMYGGTYSGFAAWAALARHPPAALKAIAATSATAPGIDLPMLNNIVRNSAYRWSGCVSGEKDFDDKTCADDARWRQLDEDWYRSGKSYRDLDRWLGGHNVIFHTWLDHPSYDRYWQKLIPFREGFAHINIPVLQTAGYYALGEAGTLYYFTEHYKYDPHANHTLLIGPYDDGSMQHGAPVNLQGYQVDQAALVDLRELRYQWFDSIFKGAEKPALLQGRVNYEVMGSNEWRHVASLEAMGTGTMRLYLDAGAGAEYGHRLLKRKPAKPTYVQQVVDFKDRSDADWTAPTGVQSHSLQLHDAIAFVSEPLQAAAELGGLFSGKLDFTVNKMDLDLNMTLYELLPSGEYLKLFEPAYEFRASYVHDPVNRRLLHAGERQHLTFRSDRLMSRKLEPGTRLLVVLGVNKRADRQINYGTGAPVNDENIDDARIPLKVRWYSDSYIDLPVAK